MSDYILDNDDILPDLSFDRFLREYKLYFYTALFYFMYIIYHKSERY